MIIVCWMSSNFPRNLLEMAGIRWAWPGSLPVLLTLRWKDKAMHVNYDHEKMLGWRTTILKYMKVDLIGISWSRPEKKNGNHWAQDDFPCRVAKGGGWLVTCFTTSELVRNSHLALVINFGFSLTQCYPHRLSLLTSRGNNSKKYSDTPRPTSWLTSCIRISDVGSFFSCTIDWHCGAAAHTDLPCPNFPAILLSCHSILLRRPLGANSETAIQNICFPCPSDPFFFCRFIGTWRSARWWSVDSLIGLYWCALVAFVFDCFGGGGRFRNNAMKVYIFVLCSDWESTVYVVTFCSLKLTFGSFPEKWLTATMKIV